MNGAAGDLVPRLAVLGAAVLVLVGVLSFSPGAVSIVAAVVLGLASLAAGLLGAVASGRR